jgi:phosphatidylglycerol:prolipoprotein diacylglycerol transferase
MLPPLLQFTLFGHPFVVQPYGICVAIAFAAAIALGHYQARLKEYPEEMLFKFHFILVLSSLAGARATFVWLEWRRFVESPAAIFRFWQGGMVFYGGLCAAFLACSAYVAFRGLSVGDVADMAAAPVALGHLIGRIGCFIHGCCYGLPTQLPWGCPFPYTSGAWVPRHPTQAYEAAGLLVLFLVLLRMSFRPHRPGTVAMTYALLYAPLRYVVEMYRADDRGGLFFGHSISQLMSIAIFILGSIACWSMRATSRVSSDR